MGAGDALAPLGAVKAGEGACWGHRGGAVSLSGAGLLAAASLAIWKAMALPGEHGAVLPGRRGREKTSAPCGSAA